MFYFSAVVYLGLGGVCDAACRLRCYVLCDYLRSPQKNREENVYGVFAVTGKSKKMLLDISSRLVRSDLRLMSDVRDLYGYCRT